MFEALVSKFEVEFRSTVQDRLAWLENNWTLSIWFSLLYVGLVFGGRKYMEQRDKFDLKLPLATWSGFLAVFSIVGMVRTLPEFMSILNKDGIFMSVCDQNYIHGPGALWTYGFVISKVFELGDTAFIILRKQRLIFLHWYHHVTVMIFCWYSYGDLEEPPAMGLWLMVMNYVVHSLMYTYYTLRACRVSLPKFVSISITAIQLMQMVVGLIVTIYSLIIKSRGVCNPAATDSMILSLLIYISYLILFANFFYHAYIKAGHKPKVTTEATNNGRHLKKSD